MSGGFIKVHRQITEWRFWDRPLYTQVWMHLLLKASWKDKSWKYGHEIGPGEMIISLREFAEECGIARSTLARILKDLENEGQIDRKVGHGKTIIKVLNYAKYQSSEKAEWDTDDATDRSTNDATDDATDRSTPYLFNRRNKERKKERIMANPTLDQIREYIYTENLMVDPDTFFDYYESQGWKLSNGNKMKDWKASCRNWHRKEVEKMNQEKKKGLAF